MPQAEVVVAVVLGLAAFFTALVVIWKAIKWLWRAFGWNGIFWAWLTRFLATVDVIATLPVTLREIDEKIDKNAGKLDNHLIDAKVKTDLLIEVDRRTRALVDIAEDVRYEVKNNGGGSMKDSVDQIKEGVAGLYAQPGELGSPGREDNRAD